MKPKNVKSSHWVLYNILFFCEHCLGEKWFNIIFGSIEKSLYKKIDDYVSKQPNCDDFEIKEFHEGSYPEPYLDRWSPVVFRGIAKEWESNKEWDFDYFVNKFGDQDVTLVDNAGLIKDSDQKNDVIKFRDYIEQMKQGSKKYLKFSRIVDENSDMKKDFDYKWLRRFRTKFSQNDLYYFFMGGKNTITPIHNGYAITVFVQIKGVKRWIFYPCNQRLFIGARPKRFNYFYSESDPYQLDNPKFPLIWHQVENVTDSIGVAYKFADVLSGFKSSKMLATCFFLATKPFLIETLLPWRGDTYNYKKK